MRVEVRSKSKNTAYGVAFIAGVLGALCMTVIMALARAIGISGFNLEMLVGSLMTGALTASSWIVGFCLHLLLGGLFALLYAAGFHSTGRSDAGVGVAYGFIHWLAAGIFMGILPALHPLMPEFISIPGFFAINAGAMSVALLLIIHLIYGGIVGAIHGQYWSHEIIVTKSPETQEIRRAA